MEQTIIPGRNGGYPCIEQLPELSSIKAAAPPYPDMVMRILGASVNDGYPCILAVAGVRERVVSNIFFAGKQVSAMYYGDTNITSAYCNGENVFGVYYDAAIDKE